MNRSQFLSFRTLSRYGIIIAFAVLCVTLSILSPYFLTAGNLSNIALQISVNGILAIGMTFVILAAGIDLSVGSVLGMAGIVAASMVAGDNVHSPLVSVGVGVAMGAVLGLINGSIIAWARVPAFVVTLGMLSAARGFTQIYNDGMPIPGLSDSFVFLGSGRLMGVPVPVWIFVALLLLAWLVLKYTRYGRYVYAVGGNEKSARTSGVPTRAVIASVYVICGACAGLASIIHTARSTTALVDAGSGYELDAIAAVVIGGTSLTGGVGGVFGSLIGVLIIGVINNGLDLLGVESYYQQVIKGAVIVLAVLIDVVSRKEN